MIDLALSWRVCILPTVRIVSSILFTLMALVLPMAGVQRYICPMNMEFSGNTDDCPMSGGDCCKGKEKNTVPDCMVKADSLPDADVPNFDQMPYLKADEVMYLRLSRVDLREIDVLPARLECGRAPPDSREWYVKQQRLLI
jgi:hypothetical protein